MNPIDSDRAALARLLPEREFATILYFEPPHAARDTRVWTGGPRDLERLQREYWDKVEQGQLAHDEPWITLVALYGLLGDQRQLDDARCAAVNTLLSRTFEARTPRGTVPRFATLAAGATEVYLPENRPFRLFLRRSLFAAGPAHPYADRRETLRRKLDGEGPSLEGNTNLDALLSGKGHDGRWIHVFVEAKFLSDISKDINYLPVRNQIVRNIDCALDCLTDPKTGRVDIEGFWFALLTPACFRTKRHGGSRSGYLTPLQPDRSRLYCYKMDEYLDPAALAADLPHWHGRLTDAEWAEISSRIGWLTFDDIAEVVTQYALLEPERSEAFRAFLRNRELWPTW